MWTTQAIEKAAILHPEWDDNTSEKSAFAENGIVVVTTHLYDGVKSLPLDLELYQHASSLAAGRKDPEFVKKPEIALSLIDRSMPLWISTRNCSNRCGLWEQ